MHKKKTPIKIKKPAAAGFFIPCDTRFGDCFPHEAPEMGGTAALQAPEPPEFRHSFIITMIGNNSIYRKMNSMKHNFAKWILAICLISFSATGCYTMHHRGGEERREHHDNDHHDRDGGHDNDHHY